MPLWSERDTSLGRLMSPQIRSAFLSRNNIEMSYYRVGDILLSSSTPVDNDLYYVEANSYDSYDSWHADNIDFTFYNPDEFYFVLKRPHKIQIDKTVYPFFGTNLLYMNNGALVENTLNREIWSSPLFYISYSSSAYYKHGAIAIRKDDHSVLSQLIKPMCECSSSCFVVGGPSTIAARTIQCPYTRIWGIGEIVRAGVSQLSTPPSRFGGSFYYSDVPIMGTSIFTDNGRFSRGFYSGVAKSTYSTEISDTSLVAITDLNPELLASLYPNVIFVDTYDELEGLLELSNDELDKIAINYDFDSPYTPGTGGGKPSSTGGGGGNFGIDPSTGQPVQSDDVAGSLPATGSFEGQVSNAGLFVHYAMNANMLEVVGDWLWADELGLIIAKEFLSILYGSPIESAISLMSYPFNVTALPGVTSQMQQMYWGAHAIGETLGGVKALAVTNPYATIDWGTVQLTEFWGNFLDYAPHTKLELYLPWCTGFVPIDPNECLPGSLRVVTNIELAKGTCLHNVIGNDGRVIATHSGTCGKQLPLTALDTSGKALQLVSMAASAIVAGGSGAAADVAGSRAADAYRRENLGDVFSGDKSLSSYRAGMASASRRASAAHSYAGRRAENRALAGAAAAFRTPASVQRNGSFTGSSAGLGVQYPYLIISRPTQSVPKQYGHHYGYPSNIYTSLLTLRGYTEIGEIHLTGFTCTEDELAEIDSLLKSGVIL